MAARWYAARTEPRAEFLAATELGRDGLDVFLPRIKAHLPRNRHPDTPLFPGYLFVRLDPEDEGWPTFRPAHRLLGWVSFGGEIAWLPDEAMGALVERVKTINREGGLWQRYQRGDKVRVVTHNLDSLAEVIEEATTPQGRAKVLLQFMGRMVQAQVPWEDLLPVQEIPAMKQPPRRRTRGGGRWLRGFGPAAASMT